MSKIPKLPFLDVFRDASSGNIKTLGKDFLETGEIPVVDQGKDLIAGYTNDLNRVCKSEPPVIIFGDHTRAIKYVDFRFAMGADGTKVLEPKVESDTKYLYYALRSLRIRDAGYSRHFKFLKETEIPIPPLEEQKRIAEILDAADALRVKRRESLAKLDDLLQSTFLDMFGDPVTNPKGWEIKSFGDVLSLITYGLTVRPTYQPSGVPLVSASQIKTGYVDFNSAHRISNDDFDNLRPKCKAQYGDLLFSKTGAIGHSAILEERSHVALAQNVARIVFQENSINNFWALYYMRTDYIQRLSIRRAKGNAQKDLQLGEIRAFPIPLPPIELQQRFAEIVSSVKKQKAKMKKQLEQLDDLFASLQQRAFRGDL